MYIFISGYFRTETLKELEKREEKKIVNLLGRSILCGIKYLMIILWILFILSTIF